MDKERFFINVELMHSCFCVVAGLVRGRDELRNEKLKTIFAVPRSDDDTNVENFFSFDEFDNALFHCIKNNVTHFFEAHSLYSEEPVACFFLYEKEDGFVVMRVGVDDEDCDLLQDGGFTLH